MRFLVRRQQYVAISHEEPTYYNSEDNVATGDDW